MKIQFKIKINESRKNLYNILPNTNRTRKKNGIKQYEEYYVNFLKLKKN